MGLAEQFVNLGEDMLGSFDARVNFLGKNIVDTHRLLDGFRKEQKTMGNKLRADLGAFVDHLTGTVKGLRHKFQRENAAAHRAWEKVTKTMEAKRRNLKGALTAAKQKAGRAH